MFSFLRIAALWILSASWTTGAESATGLEEYSPCSFKNINYPGSALNLNVRPTMREALFSSLESANAQFEHKNFPEKANVASPELFFYHQIGARGSPEITPLHLFFAKESGSFFLGAPSEETADHKKVYFISGSYDKGDWLWETEGNEYNLGLYEDNAIFYMAFKSTKSGENWRARNKELINIRYKNHKEGLAEAGKVLKRQGRKDDQLLFSRIVGSLDASNKNEETCNFWNRHVTDSESVLYTFLKYWEKNEWLVDVTEGCRFFMTFALPRLELRKPRAAFNIISQRSPCGICSSLLPAIYFRLNFQLTKTIQSVLFEQTLGGAVFPHNCNYYSFYTFNRLEGEKDEKRIVKLCLKEVDGSLSKLEEDLKEFLVGHGNYANKKQFQQTQLLAFQHGQYKEEELHRVGGVPVDAKKIVLLNAAATMCDYYSRPIMPLLKKMYPLERDKVIGRSVEVAENMLQKASETISETGSAPKEAEHKSHDEVIYQLSESTLPVWQFMPVGGRRSLCFDETVLSSLSENIQSLTEKLQNAVRGESFPKIFPENRVFVEYIRHKLNAIEYYKKNIDLWLGALRKYYFSPQEYRALFQWSKHFQRELAKLQPIIDEFSGRDDEYSKRLRKYMGWEDIKAQNYLLQRRFRDLVAYLRARISITIKEEIKDIDYNEIVARGYVSMVLRYNSGEIVAYKQRGQHGRVQNFLTRKK